MFTRFDRKKALERRHLRVRKNVQGTQERPRLSVYRSLHHIYAQIIDDTAGVTLVATSSLDPELRKTVKNGDNIEAAKQVGALVAKKALEKGLNTVIFDRGGNIYHGRVKALAEAAREAGLQF